MRPLDDLRIISIEQYGAGPYGSMHLADLGAEVIKVENPRTGGDVGRYVPPFAADGDSLFFQAFNRNKKSITLDLTSPAGRAVFEDLVAVSDAVYSNLRGDVPARLRITYEDLRGLNPAIVCCSLSGFGMTGPRAGEPSYDYIVQGLAGWMAQTGEPDGPPAKSGLSLADYCGGLVAALSLMVAIHAARRTGTGCDCDISLFDTAVSMLTYLATWHLSEGYLPARTRHSAHPSLVPFQNFETSDGWIVVACAKEKFWHQLIQAAGLTSLRDDPRYSGFEARLANREPLLAELEARFRANSTETWLRRLSAAGVPCAPVNNVVGALADPQVSARSLVVATEHPRWGSVHHVASPVRVGAEAPHYQHAPELGGDVLDVARNVLRYDDDRLTALRRAGAFGSATPTAAGLTAEPEPPVGAPSRRREPVHEQN